MRSIASDVNSTTGIRNKTMTNIRNNLIVADGSKIMLSTEFRCWGSAESAPTAVVASLKLPRYPLDGIRTEWSGCRGISMVGDGGSTAPEARRERVSDGYGGHI